MNRATPFVIAVGVALMAAPAAYLFSPEKQLDIPAPKTLQVERLAPLSVSPSVVRKPVTSGSVTRPPKAVVKTPKKSKPMQKTKGTVRKTVSDGRDFATDLQSLQDCAKLNALRAAGKRPNTDYEYQLARSLIPWYMKNCIFT